MSPYEARVLKTPPADKVQGKRLMHFWAFFDRTARENDYLWGRLDGAAHLIGILLGKNHPEYRQLVPARVRGDPRRGRGRAVARRRDRARAADRSRRG